MGHAGPQEDRSLSHDADPLRTVDVLAVGAHPDDVELGCGGTLAALARRGRTFGILDLTRGEAGTRGTPETRAVEAAEAARILGAAFRETLDLGDGALRTDREAELLVVDVVRRRRPRLVLAQWERDRHPDHGRASRLVTEAAFYAGLRSLATGLPAHRPQQVVYFPSSFAPEPDFLVDITASFSTKLAAVRAYRTQFHAAAGAAEGESETFISSKTFFDAIEAQARAFGRLSNVDFAEGFVGSRPPTLADPVAAFEGYEPGFPAGDDGLARP